MHIPGIMRTALTTSTMNSTRFGSSRTAATTTTTTTVATSTANAYDSSMQSSTSAAVRQRGNSAGVSIKISNATLSQQQQHQQQQHQQQQPAKPVGKVWKTAVDPKTGRTYYYDAITRETQWRKPLELATEEERKTMARKEKKQKDFFSAMEANILKNMAAGSFTPVVKQSSSLDDEERDNVGELVHKTTGPKTSVQKTSVQKTSVQKTSTQPACRPMCSSVAAEATKTAPTNKPSKAKPLLAKPNMVRTISSMDNHVLAELTRMEKNDTVPLRSGLGEQRVSPTSVVNNRDDDGDVMHPQFVQLRTTDSEEEEEVAIEEIRRVAQSMTTIDVHQRDDAPKTSGNRLRASTGTGTVQGKSKSVKPGLAKPNLRKRNTCGTLYVGSTMSAPDKDATIKCICAVFRAHLLQSAMETAPPVRFEEYEVFKDMQQQKPRSKFVSNTPISSQETFGCSHSDFNDCYSLSSSSTSHSRNSSVETDPFQSLSLQDKERAASVADVPSLEEITNFYRGVFRKSQMESDCIIMSLIYVERLIKETNGGVRPRVSNWRSILFSAMILSSKVWDDLSMWNADFSQCVSCPAGVSFSVQRINELERAVLNCLKYNVKVSASEYAKYYFLLRSMLIRSGLGDKEDLNSLSPLDVEGARQLELRSSIILGNIEEPPTCELQHGVLSGGTNGSPGNSPGGTSNRPSPIRSNSRRAKSMGDASMWNMVTGSDADGSSPSSTCARRANLEQVVQM